MNAYSFALYRAARRLMTEPEVTQAAQLARDADAGNTSAGAMLRTMVISILMEPKGRERAAAAD